MVLIPLQSISDFALPKIPEGWSRSVVGHLVTTVKTFHPFRPKVVQEEGREWPGHSNFERDVDREKKPA